MLSLHDSIGAECLVLGVQVHNVLLFIIGSI